MSIDEQLIASISGPVSNTAVEPIQTSGMEQVQEQPKDIVAEPQVNSGMEEAPKEANTSQPEPIVPDYNKYVEEITGGTFKDVEAFKQALPKLSGYDTLLKERDEFKAKAEKDPFASDYSRIMNDLIASGATPDQLNNFQKINAIGDINALSPVDAKVAKLVLVDGYKESVARKMVDRDYPVNDYEDGSDDKEIIEEKLRIDANSDKNALAKYKAETSTVKNPNEDVQLQQLAQRQQHENYVKQEVPKIASQINGMGELSITLKDQKDPLKMQFDYPAEFKAQIANNLEKYFMDGTTPINQETMGEAFKTINAAYLDEYFPAIAERIANAAAAKAWEAATNKYENRSGLPKSPEIQVTPNKGADYNNFLKGLVGQ